MMASIFAFSYLVSKIDRGVYAAAKTSCELPRFLTRLLIYDKSVFCVHMGITMLSHFRLLQQCAKLTKALHCMTHPGGVKNFRTRPTFRGTILDNMFAFARVASISSQVGSCPQKKVLKLCLSL
jgi:hypothetical protein